MAMLLKKSSILITSRIILLLFLSTACQMGEIPAPGSAVLESGLPPTVNWQIQYSGDLDLDLEIDIFNLDLFDTSIEIINQLKKRRVFVICYFSAGSYEEWRPDADHYPEKVLGNDLDNWPGERWLDIRQLSELEPIIENRLDLAVEKGCDGVDPDNLDGYENDTGFPLTGNDQLAFNTYLARAAHTRDLKIGLKNDLNQVRELVNDFDWILNEECFTYRECDLLLPFLEASKPVFVIEYQKGPADFCSQANHQGFSALHKNRELDAYFTDCHQFTTQ